MYKVLHCEYLPVDFVVSEIKYWQWADVRKTFSIQTAYFVVTKIEFLLEMKQ